MSDTVTEGPRPSFGVGERNQRLWAQVVAGGGMAVPGSGLRGVWPAAPQAARFPLAHLKTEDVEPESVRIMSEVLKALRPFPDARRAVRERFAELFRDVPVQ